MKRLTDVERGILCCVSPELPRGPRPYAEVAKNLGITEEEVLERLRGLINRGIIRRLAAVLQDRELGYAANAMVAWRIPEAEIERAGAIASGKRQISHVYARETAPDWPYNLYTMIHAKTEDGLRRVVDEHAREFRCTDFKVLKTVREYTKRPPDYSVLLKGIQ